MYSITKTTPFAIYIAQGEKTLKIPGESFERGYGSPDFIIEKNTEYHWFKTDGTTSTVKTEERALILQFVLDTLREKGWDITSE